MTDALNAAPEGPQTDTLTEQVEVPNPQTNTVPEPEPETAPEPKADKSAEEKRSDTVRKAIDKALDEKPEEKKADEAKKGAEKPTREAEPKVEAKAKAEPKEAEPEQAEAKPEDTKPAPKPTAYKEPPSGFDDAAKAEWEAVPESVRGAVHRRSQEMERGIQKYRQAAEQFEGVRQYAEMAKQGGTDLPTALSRYTQMEQTLRQNPIQGLQAVVANLDIKKPDGSPVTLRDIAASIMGQTPDQAAARQEATISQLNRQITQLQEQIGGFSKHVEQQQRQSRVTSAESEWNGFKAEHPRAAELEPQIAEFLTKYPADNMPAGERLRDAYNWAVAQNPPSVAHTDPSPLAQTQPTPKVANPAGQKSISGAPGGNSANPRSRNLSRKEAIDKAMRQAGI